MRIGAHVSIASGVHKAIGRQRDVGGNCGQIFTTSPQVWQEPSIDDDDAEAFRNGTADRIAGPWVIHAGYLINLATPKDDLRDQSIANLQADIDAAARLGIPYVNVHLGAHTGAGDESGLANAAAAIDRLSIPEGVTLVLETDAGSGTKLGGTFEQLATVLEDSDYHLDVCLDTAHTLVAGYDLTTKDGVDATVDEFDEVIGLDRLVCIHLNDSKHPLGSHSDEHAHIGEGEIGVDGMRAILNHPDLRDLPFILETPKDDEKGFAENIEAARALRD